MRFDSPRLHFQVLALRLTLGPRPALLAGVGWGASFPIPLLGFTLSAGLSVLLFCHSGLHSETS